MVKRRRLLNTPGKKSKPNSKEATPVKADREVRAARGRLMGALLEALGAEDSDTSEEYTPSKRKKNTYEEVSSEDEHKDSQNDNRQSYVLKLFDRSVDLSQFNEDSPLYPICRAWIANKPKANYSLFGKDKFPEPPATEESVSLPGPRGASVSRIPPLLPEQQAADKNNINLNYREAPPPTREALVTEHLDRWANVRRAWIQQAACFEARYADTQRVLEDINVNAM